MDPSNEDAPEIIAECKAAIQRRTVVRPLEVQRLIDYFDRNDFNYRVEDQSLHMGIGRGYFIFSIANEGTDLSMWAAIPEDVSMELRQRLIQACNDWNGATTWPKVYVASLDDGRQRLCAEQFVTARYGLTDAQVSTSIERFVASAEAFFKDQIERIPALGGTQE